MKIKLVPIGHKAQISQLEYLKQFMAAVNDELDTHRAHFNSATGNWEHPVTFKINKARYASGGIVEGSVFAEHEILSHVNYGTRRRAIVSRKKVMKFQLGYKARTRKGSVRSGGKVRYGEWVRTRRVGRHKIEGRHFDVTIIGYRKNAFPRRVQLYLNRANKRAWRTNG